MSKPDPDRLRPVLVTGAGGFVGAALVRALRSLSRPVVGADLRCSGTASLAFDVTDGPAVRAALREVNPSVVVHGAALVDDRIAAGTFERINVGGTRTVLDACVALGDQLERLVHVSSIAALGTAPPPGQTDESPPAVNATAPYFGTKARSEALVREALRRGDLRGVIVRPGDVYGPGSEPWVERPLAALRARQPILVDGGRGQMSPCHIDNLVAGLILAIDHPAALGGTFTFHDGRALPYRAYLDALADAAGLPRARGSLPKSLALLGTSVAACVYALPGGRALPPLPLSSSAVRYLSRQSTYSIEHARAELGYDPKVDLEAGMQELARTFHSSPA